MGLEKRWWAGMIRRRIFWRVFLCLLAVILASITSYIIDILLYPPHPPPGAGDSPLAWLNVREWHWPTQEYECVPYVVQWDDYSIWTIAAKLYPGQHTGRMVWAIRRASEREGADGVIVHRGDILWVPDPQIYGRNGRAQLAAGK